MNVVTSGKYKTDPVVSIKRFFLLSTTFTSSQETRDIAWENYWCPLEMQKVSPVAGEVKTTDFISSSPTKPSPPKGSLV